MLTKSVVSLCFLGVAGGAWAADVKVIEQIVAKVNNEIVTLGELDRSRKQMETELRRQQMPAAKAQELMKQAEPDLLRDRIDQLLLVQKGKELEIKVDQEVSRYM
ncbi:MAG: SurA N-terminal domain-containing protein, partial [Bryobacteraceae bacterium]